MRTGRYSQPDPIEPRGGWNRFGYVERNPLTLKDPSGSISWSGTMFSSSPGPEKSSTRDEYVLVSECKNGVESVIDVVAYTARFGVGFASTGSTVTSADGFDYINPMAFAGPYYKYAVGVAIGIGGSYSRTQIGAASSSGWGSEGELDVGAWVVAGTARVVSSRSVSCGCPR